MGLIELGLQRMATKAHLAFLARARDGLNRAVAGPIDTDAVVFGVSDQHVSRFVDAEVFWPIKPRQSGVAAVA